MITEVEATQDQEVTFPELDAVTNESALVLVEFRAITIISNQQEYQKVSQMVLDSAANIKKIEAHTETHKKSAYARWERICSVIRGKIAPWEEIKKKGSTLLAAYQYQQEQERIRREDEERARKQQEALIDQAAQAEQLASEGRVEDGLALLDYQPVAAPVVAQRTVPAVKGIGGPKLDYKAKVTNLFALVVAIAEGKAPLQAIVADQSFLDKHASLYKDSFSMPGCELTKTPKLSSVRAPK